MTADAALQNGAVVAFGVPLTLIVCGALIKKIIRGSSWRSDDWFLGVELCFASLSASIFNIVHVIGSNDAGARGRIAGVYLVLCFALLLGVMSIHQTWNDEKDGSFARVAWLGGVSNVIGALLLALFYLGINK